MKILSKTLVSIIAFSIVSTSLIFGQSTRAERQLAANLEMYERVWDDVINNGNIDEINEKHFDENVTMITQPENIVGIDAFKAYYQNFITGFSDITFTIYDAYGQGDKMVKHWNFKGTHTGNFFGIPPTGNKVDVEGATIIKMKNGKIAQEQDFFDNMVFFQQLGLLSNPTNISTIQALYDAFGKGDIPTVLAGLDREIVWNEAEGNKYADGNPYTGPDAVFEGIFARIGADYEYFKLKDIQLHDMSNNQVLATLRYDGKFKKNGALIDAQAAHLWTLRNGKVIAFQQYVDTRQLAEAEGKN